MFIIQIHDIAAIIGNQNEEMKPFIHSIIVTIIF